MDDVDVVRAGTNQEAIHKQRRVSQEFRGEHAGETTGFGADAILHVAHTEDQKGTHDYKRVNEQIRSTG
jgi:hypothetical protein